MLRKVLVIIAVTAISISCMSGCKKRSGQAEPEEEVPKTIAEYEAEAEECITKKNLARELERIEKEIEQEIGQEQ